MEILKNIPMPIKSNDSITQTLRRMEPGDCIKPSKPASSVLPAIKQAKDINDADFKVMTIKGQTHVWRLR